MTRDERLAAAEQHFKASLDTPNDGPADFGVISAGSVGLDINDITLVMHPRNTSVSKQHTHDFLEMIYVIKGSCYQVVLDTELDLAHGDLCILTPGTMHGIAYAEKDSAVINILVSRGAVEKFVLNLFREEAPLIDFFTRMLYSPEPYPYAIFATGDDSRLDDVVLDMLTEYINSGANTGLYLKSCLTMLFFHLMREYGHTMLVGETNGEHAGTAVVSYIRENFARVTLADTARHFHYSKSHISHTVKALTGSTFNDLVRALRLKKAAVLLKDSDLPVPDIMEAVGYRDPSNFYKAFKAEYGSTPGRYRGRD